MAGKKASQLGDRFRNVTMRERGGGNEAGGPVPALSGSAAGSAPAVEPAEGLAGPPEVGAPAPVTGTVARSYGRGGQAGRPKTVGRKARVGLRPGTGRHRFTLDLDGVQHRYLKQLALDAQTDMASVVRVLISSLEEDPVLRNEVAMRARGEDGIGGY